MSLLTHMERWKDIEGYEGLYQVSTCGRVKSLGNYKSKKEKILKQCKMNTGYLVVNLYKDGKIKMFKVHRLVAKAFIPNPLNLPCVNHKTEDKTMNYVWCLEWCDYSYNNNYGTHNEKVSKTLTNRKDKSKKILCVETNKIYPSAMEAQRQTGIYQSNIVACLKERKKTTGGYHWKYVD